jgi:hypothetical protein
MFTITESDIVTHTIDSEYNTLVISNSKKAEIGGKSQIRNTADRIKSLNEDQLVGQISTFCGSMILTGSPQGYIQAREKANSNPTSGDGGIDIIGLSNIDIKGSLMRYSTNPLNYRLLVRPRERHNNWIYVLGLVPKERPYKCHFVGWAKDSDLPKETYNGSIKSLHGAYVIEAINLRKISDLIKEINYA